MVEVLRAEANEDAWERGEESERGERATVVGAGVKLEPGDCQPKGIIRDLSRLFVFARDMNVLHRASEHHIPLILLKREGGGNMFDQKTFRFEHKLTVSSHTTSIKSRVRRDSWISRPPCTLLAGAPPSVPSRPTSTSPLPQLQKLQTIPLKIDAPKKLESDSTIAIYDPSR